MLCLGVCASAPQSDQSRAPQSLNVSHKQTHTDIDQSGLYLQETNDVFFGGTLMAVGTFLESTKGALICVREHCVCFHSCLHAEPGNMGLNVFPLLASPAAGPFLRGIAQPFQRHPCTLACSARVWRFSACVRGAIVQQTNLVPCSQVSELRARTQSQTAEISVLSQ